VAALLFPVAVMGLFAPLDAPRPRLAVVGLVIACCAQLAGVVSVLGLFLGPPEWAPTGSTVTVLTPFITLAALGSLAGLLLVGIVIRRTDSLPGRWAALPIVLALTAVPLIMFSPALQMINDGSSTFPL
jgi:hypothetical protein